MNNIASRHAARCTLAVFWLTALSGRSVAAAPPQVHTDTLTVITPSGTDAGVCQESTPNCHSKAPWELELEQAKSAWGACQPDVDTLCEGVQVGEGRIEACLKAHRSKLSKKCRAQLAAQVSPKTLSK